MARAWDDYFQKSRLIKMHFDPYCSTTARDGPQHHTEMNHSRQNLPQGHELTATGARGPADHPGYGRKNPNIGTIRPVIAVLGATGTIGRGIVEALIDSGRGVVAVAGESVEPAQFNGANSRGDLTILAAAIDGDAAAGRLARALRDLGRAVDAIVVAPPDVTGGGRLLDHPTEHLQQALEQDVLPQLAVARALLPLLAEGGRGGRYLIVVGPGSERAWAGYGYRSVTTAALRMLGLVLHDEARSLGVRVQFLAIDSPVRGDPRSPHECGEWPSALAVGHHVLQEIDGNAALPAAAAASFARRVDSSTPHSTTQGRVFTDVPTFLKTLTTRR